MNGDLAILRCDRRCGCRPSSASSPPTGEREYGESALLLIPSESTPSLLNLNSFLLGLRCDDGGGVGEVSGGGGGGGKGGGPAVLNLGWEIRSSRRIIGELSVGGSEAHLECEYCRAPSIAGGDLTGDAPSTDAPFSPSISERSSVEYAAEVSCVWGVRAGR